MNNEKNPYKPEDFEVQTMRLDDNNLLALINMPRPWISPECYQIFLMYDIENEKATYVTTERGDGLQNDEDGHWLCGWTENGRHNNYGSYHGKIEDISLSAVRIHMGKEYMF